MTFTAGKSSVTLKPRSCDGVCETTPVTVADEPDEPTGPRIRYWSNPDDWDYLPGRIPIEDDDIEIW